MEAALQACQDMEAEKYQQMSRMLCVELMRTTDNAIKQMLKKVAEPFGALQAFDRDLIALWKEAQRQLKKN